MTDFLTFGEIMLRLKSPAHERFFQSPTLEATFGGGEANVAVSLANYGLNAGFVSALPANDIGEAALRELRRFSVDTSNVLRSGSRIGIYFLETGSNQRPSKVVYDRAGSSICEAGPGDFDWPSDIQRRKVVPYHGHHAGAEPECGGPVARSLQGGQESGRDCILRFQLPWQAVEVRQVRAGSHA